MIVSHMKIGLPKEIPVMTLPGTVFFPHTLMPLHIFEQRYRRMLQSILDGDRIFAVAALDRKAVADPDVFEPPCAVATAGLIRMCQTNDDGTSNLLLQGFARIEVEAIVQESPFRIIKIRPMNTSAGAKPDRLASLHRELMRLLKAKIRLGARIPDEVLQMLGHIDDPDAVSDLAAYTLCEGDVLKQTLLESDTTKERLQLIIGQMRADLAMLQLSRKLQGDLGDDAIADN
jgi:ATP-dependent Lon protease